MAFTLAQLRSRLETATDTENDTHLSNTQKNEFLASAASETWDHVCSSGMSDRFVKSVSFNTVPGQQEYVLGTDTYVTDNDFYKIHEVYVNEGNNEFRPLPRINSAETQNFRPPVSAVPIKLYYIRKPPTFRNAAGLFDDSLTLDVPDGIEEHTIVTAALAVKKKKDDDWRGFLERKQELEQRIAHMGKTDWSQPSRVVRRRHRIRDGYWYPYNHTLTAFMVRGQKLELLYAYPFVP
jgi:hypothetical protein